MKKVLLFFAGLSLISCEKDDSDKRCTTDCTRIHGSVVTMDNQPLANVKVHFDYNYSPGIGFQIRRIADTKTDASGNYGKDFYIEDDELGVQQGYFEMELDDSHLSDDLYIKIGNFDGSPEALLYDIGTRDTIIDFSFYIPRKAFIKVHLNNFVPQQPNDYFEVQAKVPFGREIAPGQYAWNTIGRDIPNTQQNQFYDDVVVAQGANNIVVIAKRKNGVMTFDEYPITVPAGENDIELTFEY